MKITSDFKVLGVGRMEKSPIHRGSILFETTKERFGICLSVQESTLSKLKGMPIVCILWDNISTQLTPLTDLKDVEILGLSLDEESVDMFNNKIGKIQTLAVNLNFKDECGYSSLVSSMYNDFDLFNMYLQGLRNIFIKLDEHLLPKKLLKDLEKYKAMYNNYD